MVTPAMIIGASITSSPLANYPYASRTRRTIQRARRHGKLVRTEQNSDDPSIPENAHKLHRLTPFSQAPSCLWKAFGGQKEPPKADQSVSCSRRYAGRRDERCECNGGRQDCTLLKIDELVINRSLQLVLPRFGTLYNRLFLL